MTKTELRKLSALGLVLLSVTGGYLARNDFQKPKQDKPAISKQEKPKSTSKDTSNNESNPTTAEDFSAEAADLRAKEFTTGSSIIEKVNGDKSTLNPTEWVGPKIIYSGLDSSNRVGAATAYLTKVNYGISEGREAQKWSPTGWHNQAKRVDGKRVFPQNRGHLIAYTLSFNFDQDGNLKNGELGSIDNPKNLFTQSAYSNQVPFQVFEELVRKSIRAGSKVTYRVQPIFRDGELMARGLWAQAVSDTGDVDFNVYIHNVQPGIQFNYTDGTSKVDQGMKIKEYVKGEN